MDLNEQLKGWLQQQFSPGGSIDKGGLALSQAGQTIGQDAAAGASILNDPRNSWIGMNPVGKLAAGGLGLAGALGQIAYHGSPHAFEKFALSKVGTGEGAQVYGHGLYLAENPKVAEQYAKKLPYRDFQRKVQDVYSEFDHPDDAMDALKEAGLSGPQLKLMDALKNDNWLGFDYPHQAVRAVLSKEAKQYDPSPETLKAAEGLSHMYKVDLPDEAIAKMLDFDTPLSKQPAEVQASVKQALGEYGMMVKPGPHEGGWALWNDSSGYPLPGTKLFKTEEEAQAALNDPKGSLVKTILEEFMKPAEASSHLNKNGIPGLKYLDGMSRDGLGVGTRNYVVFDDQLPIIKERGGLGLVPRETP